MAVCPNGHDSASDDFCDVCGMRIGGNPNMPATGPSAGVSTPPRGSWNGPAAGTAELCPRCGTHRVGQFCESCGFNFSTRGPVPANPSPVPANPSSISANPGSISANPGSISANPSSISANPSPTFTPANPNPVPPPAPSYSSEPQSPQASSAPPAPSSFPYPQTTWTAEVGADRTYYERVQAVTGAEGAAVTFPSYYTERRFQLLGNQMRIGRRSVSRGLAPEIDLTGPPADPGISRLHAVLIAVPDGTWAVLDPGSANGTLLNGTEIAVGDQVPLHDGDRINLGAWTAITVHRD